MDTRKMYNDAYAKTKIGEAAFRRAFNGAVRYLISRYGIKYVTDDEEKLYINNAGDESSLYDAYFTAVQSYVETAGETDIEKYGSFTALSDIAYRTVWKEKSKGRRIRGCSF